MITVVVVVALAIVLTLPHSSNSMPVDGGEKNVAPEVVAVVNSNERQGIYFYTLCSVILRINNLLFFF